MKESFRTGIRVDKSVWVEFLRIVHKKGLKSNFAITEAIKAWIEANRD